MYVWHAMRPPIGLYFEWSEIRDQNNFIFRIALSKCELENTRQNKLDHAINTKSKNSRIVYLVFF